MKYRVKLLLIFLAAAVITNGVSVGLLYHLARHYLFEEYRAKVLSVAATAASMLDGETHKQIRTREDEASAAYQKLRDQLRRARDANRRQDTYVRYMHTFMPAAQDPKVVEFAVDPEEDFKNFSHVGDVYHVIKGRPIHLDQAQVDSQFTEDQWGVWVSANAPVRDAAGKVVAAVGVDFSAQRAHERLQPLFYSAVGALSLAVVLAVSGAFVVSRRVTRPLEELHAAVNAIGKGQFDARVEARSKDEIGDLARAVNTMATGLKERETVKSAFARYVSRQVMDSVLSSGQTPQVKGDRRKITVMFCDIRGFTSMSEQMRPEEVVALLNEYFERMVEIVFRNQGTLDKFIGDGMMVIFGAPADDPYQEEHALRAAEEMQRELRALSEKWQREGRPPIRIGIGINSGTAIVGNIGASERMEYTAIGDTVNLASRLQAATRDVNADILMSEYTYHALRGVVKANKIGPVQVKGRSEPVVTYAVQETA